jgi:hypothetical protein
MARLDEYAQRTLNHRKQRKRRGHRLAADVGADMKQTQSMKLRSVTQSGTELQF